MTHEDFIYLYQIHPKPWVTEKKALSEKKQKAKDRFDANCKLYGPPWIVFGGDIMRDLCE